MSSEVAAAIETSPSGCLVRLRVIPRAKKTAIDGMRGDALLMRLAAPPVDDAANEALLRFVADAFEVSRSAVRLVSGQRARDKRVSIDGVTRAAAIARLSALIASAGAGR